MTQTNNSVRQRKGQWLVNSLSVNKKGNTLSDEYITQIIFYMSDEDFDKILYKRLMRQ